VAFVKRAPLLIAIVATVFFSARAAAGQEVVYVVRHAERADQTPDSALSTEGVGRAYRLAEMLKSAGITHVFTSDTRRAPDTAAPLAKAAHLTPRQLPGADTPGLVARIGDLGPRARVLVVGHSNTVPELLRALHVDTSIAIADDEYDNLFIVVPRNGAAPTLIRLKY